MPRLFAVFLLFLISMACFPNIAYAHGDGLGDGFLSGFLHPVLGFDHLLAMISVGVISAQIGGRAIWSVPSTFVLVMALGGIVGIYGVAAFTFQFSMIFVEHGIIASVIILGLTIALDKKMRQIFAMAMVGFFAFFHGFAHGYELPEFSAAWQFIAGFMCGTAGLHICGVLIGFAAQRIPKGTAILRHMGSALIGIGLLMVLQSAEYYFAAQSAADVIAP